uniref:ubiquitin carboxyl-terminal hydrolase 37-like n=1 Tax=Oncorhynchus gorbuscha TaxID=8017 RepID=UPI001EAF00CE|nr:ubiquitin carboxyl-terminal hydrolase 37-like [Oncorhynchus gorbuscha]
MSAEEMETLLFFVGTDLTKQTTNYRTPIEPKQRLAVTLRSPAKHPSPVKSSPGVSRPSSPSPTNPLDSHGDTSQEGATFRPLSLQDHSISRPQRSGSGARSQTLPRASSATRRTEETQGARGERGALVNMELLGLPNIGNTCFLNATLQCLLVLPSFSKEILRQEQLWSSSPFSNLLRCLSDVHRSGLPDSGANQASKADLMWKVKYSLSGYDLKYLGDTQQDAHELLVNMLCQLKEEGMILKTLGVNYTCPVSQLEFQLVSVRTCTSCGRESSTREDYNHLSLDFSSERTLLSSLALTFKREKVEFTCAGCKGLHASKVEQFHTLPLVLVLHLKRFGGPGGLEKLEAPLLFPSELRLSTFCGDTVPPLHSANPQALTNQTPNIQVSIPQTLASQVSNPPGEAKDIALCCSEAASEVSEWLLPADWRSLSFGRLRKLRCLLLTWEPLSDRIIRGTPNLGIRPFDNCLCILPCCGDSFHPPGETYPPLPTGIFSLPPDCLVPCQ